MNKLSSNSKIALENILWPLSAIILTYLSHKVYSLGPNFYGGEHYIMFSMLYIPTVLILKRFLPTSGGVSLPFYSLGVLILLFGYPLYENDQFRYLWEGKVLFFGENPYIHPPDSKALEHISFSAKEHIGYPYLSTIYPLLALIWFGLGGVWDYEIGLRIMMLLNGALVYYLFTLLKDKINPIQLLILFPYLQKEFIQAIHIDLLAFLFFFLYLVKDFKMSSFNKSLSLILLSIWTKVLGAIGLFFLFFQIPNNEKKKIRNILKLIVSAISLPLLFYWVSSGGEELSGVKAFSSTWIWNPGFFSILERAFNLDQHSARTISFLFYGFFSMGIVLRMILKIRKSSFVISKPLLIESIFLLFSGLMFFTPVYNAWYAIWFLGPALILKSWAGIFYGAFSSFSYMSYWNEDYLIYAELLTHIWFPIILYSTLRSRRATSTT